MENITFTLSFSNTKENLELLADLRGYQSVIPKTKEEMPDRFDEEGNQIYYSIQETLKENPDDRVTWLKKHTQEFIQKEIMKTFGDYYKRQAVLMAEERLATSIGDIVSSVE